MSKEIQFHLQEITADGHEARYAMIVATTPHEALCKLHNLTTKGPTKFSRRADGLWRRVGTKQRQKRGYRVESRAVMHRRQRIESITQHLLGRDQ